MIDEADLQRIDGAVQLWRQGDCTLGEHWFLFRLEVAAPLTRDAVEAAAEGVDTAETEVRGFMVATQTCDIVRSCATRPYVEVCPLVEVDADQLEEIRKGRRPQYAFVPGVADRRLVADLDRTMTLEKAVIADWDRTVGCRDDSEARRLSLALARKRTRTAFPNDFVEFAIRLTSRMASKHGKQSEEGRALRALREIRVRAAPSWSAQEAELTFWFIRNEDEPMFEDKGWAYYLERWLAYVPPSGRFASVEGIVQTLDDLTAREYVESDPLDLDHLSAPAASL